MRELSKAFKTKNKDLETEIQQLRQQIAESQKSNNEELSSISKDSRINREDNACHTEPKLLVAPTKLTPPQYKTYHKEILTSSCTELIALGGIGFGAWLLYNQKSSQQQFTAIGIICVESLIALIATVFLILTVREKLRKPASFVIELDLDSSHFFPRNNLVVE